MSDKKIKKYVELNGMSNKEIKDLFDGFIGKEVIGISENCETYGMGVNSYHFYKGILKENEWKKSGYSDVYINFRNHFDLATLKRFNMFEDGRLFGIDCEKYPCGDKFDFYEFFNTYFTEGDENFMWVVDNTVYYWSGEDYNTDPEKLFKTYNLILNLGYDLNIEKGDINDYFLYTFLNSQSLYFDLKYNDELNNLDIDNMTNIINNINRVSELNLS